MSLSWIEGLVRATGLDLIAMTAYHVLLAILVDARDGHVIDDDVHERNRIPIRLVDVWWAGGTHPPAEYRGLLTLTTLYVLNTRRPGVLITEVPVRDGRTRSSVARGRR